MGKDKGGDSEHEHKVNPAQRLGAAWPDIAQRESQQELNENQAERISGEPQPFHAGVWHVAGGHGNPGVKEREEQNARSQPIVRGESREIRARGDGR